jgi:hypothetical protein
MDKEGLDMGLSGLVTLIREPLLRPVQIVRQFISNLKTGNSRYAAYHENNGLSSTLKNQGSQKDIQSYGYNKPYSWHMQILGHIGLGYIGLVVWNK